MLIVPLMLALAAQEPPAAPPPAQTETLDIARDGSARMTVPVTVGGKGPFDFIIDTGADRTVVSKDMARRLALKSAGTARMVSLGGVTTVDLVDVGQIGLGSGHRSNAVAAAALDHRNIGAHGLLGVDSLAGRRVVMDFRRQEMRLVPSVTPRDREAQDEIVVTARSRYGQLIVTDARVNGQRVTVIIHSGAQSSVGNSRLLALLERRRRLGQLADTELIDVVGHTIPAKAAMLREITPGRRHHDRPRRGLCRCRTLPPFPDR